MLLGKLDKISKMYYFVDYCTNGCRLWSPQHENNVVRGCNLRSKTLLKMTPDDKRGSYSGGEDEGKGKDISEGPEVITEGTELDNESVRRSTRERKPPQYLKGYFTLALGAKNFLDDVPLNYEDIKGREDENMWYKAVQEDIDCNEV
ncbi:hypothetical protein PR048_002918 [Dryococelus australis]|uniref:Uncharacterized protein n=1 Tax=Dryococelus australis TaxID=614101 RepID=A0ABQ9ILQ1_9NEOP|nr:hypothetical protein PR048_002918 [Dryococelus australis]